ncbi:hypothetical protein [Rubritalea tangerina]
MVFLHRQCERGSILFRILNLLSASFVASTGLLVGAPVARAKKR